MGELNRGSSTLGQYIKTLRQERGWSQAQLASHSGISKRGYRTISDIEIGKKHDSGYLDNIAAALGIEPVVLRRLVAPDPRLSPGPVMPIQASSPSEQRDSGETELNRREFVKGVVAPFVVYLGQKSSDRLTRLARWGDEDVRDLQSLQDPFEADDRLLERIARHAWSGNQDLAESARLGAASLLHKYQDEINGTNEAIKRIVACANIVMAVSYHEAAVRPPEIALEHLNRAIALSGEIGSFSIMHYAMWCKGLHLRKWGDASKDRDSLYFYEAINVLDAISNDARSTSLTRAFALQERAKVELGRKNDTLFGDFMNWADQQAADVRSIGEHSSEFWPEFKSDHLQAIVRDTRIRGIGTFGGSLQEMDELARDMLSFPRGLFENMTKLTLPYSQSKARMLSSESSGDEQITAFSLWWSTLQYAEKHNQRRQIDSGRKIFRELDQSPVFRSWRPSAFSGMCWRCMQRDNVTEPTRWVLDIDLRTYRCVRCDRYRSKLT